MAIRKNFGILFWLFITVLGFHVGYVNAYTNQTANVINALFELEGDDATLFQSMLGSFGVGSMMFGTPFAARLIPRGRLKVLWLASFIGVVGTLL